MRIIAFCLLLSAGTAQALPPWAEELFGIEEDDSAGAPAVADYMNREVYGLNAAAVGEVVGSARQDGERRLVIQLRSPYGHHRVLLPPDQLAEHQGRLVTALQPSEIMQLPVHRGELAPTDQSDLTAVPTRERERYVADMRDRLTLWERRVNRAERDPALRQTTQGKEALVTLNRTWQEVRVDWEVLRERRDEGWQEARAELEQSLDSLDEAWEQVQRVG